jgi:hypothetical protein
MWDRVLRGRFVAIKYIVCKMLVAKNKEIISFCVTFRHVKQKELPSPHPS